MDKFLKRRGERKVGKRAEQSPKTFKDAETAIKNLYLQKASAPGSFIGKFYQTCKEDLVLFCKSYFR